MYVPKFWDRLTFILAIAIKNKRFKRRTHFHVKYDVVEKYINAMPISTGLCL
jgi:hypothetical protein